MLSTYYNVLGVCRMDSKSEVRAAYLKLARELHPDRIGDTPEANSKFAEITRAYAALTDAVQRKTYNAELELLTDACHKCEGRGRWKRQRGFTVVTWARCEVCGGCGRLERAR